MRTLNSLILTIFLSGIVVAQQLYIPRASPQATISQIVGISEVTIKYARPSKKEREIFGKLVPYGEVWRIGANENTTITLSTDGKIQGEKVPAGTYGMHAIPGEKEWTVILSKDNNLWGSGGYNPENDLNRFLAIPVKTTPVEFLTFSFEDVQDEFAVVTLSWDETKISFLIEFNTSELVQKKVNEATVWQPAMQGAMYILNKNGDLKEGLRLINISTAINTNYANLRIKAQLLNKSGDKNQAIEVMEQAIAIGKEMKNKPFDFEAMQKLLADWKSGK